MKPEIKKQIILHLPYLAFIYLFGKVGQAFRLAQGADISAKLLHIGQGFSAAFASAAPSFHPTDLLIGLAAAVIIRLVVYSKQKNAKKYRKGMEYGTARWGTVLSMSLDNGGHLSHGSPVNISGKIFNFIHYGANKSGWIDTNDFIDKLYKFNPKLVVIGASAYSRALYFDTFRNVIDCYKKQTGNECYMLVDMAHIAGLVAAGDHPSPFGIADIITTTTHKTLRGTRGGLIFCKPELAKRIDSAVFPLLSGRGAAAYHRW